MTTVRDEAPGVRAAPIPTWFGVGGGAERFARPSDSYALAELVRTEPAGVRVLGDGANLLVDDEGVTGLVVALDRLDSIEALDGATPAGTVRVRAGAGVKLPKLIGWAVRHGLAGIETIAGIPASMGGAVVMNAGGRFGEIADVVRSAQCIDANGDTRELPASELGFGYRTSAPVGLIVCSVEIELQRVEGRAHDELRARHRDVLTYKRETQPMGDRCAGCVFKNPLVDTERVSAGMLIDRAGCKGLEVGGARVSDRHANFVLVDPKRAQAAHIIELMRTVRARVAEAHAVVLEPEVVIWSERPDPLAPR
ncbi:MAG: UDP-N-acetylmuramate dehydrogenase [Planctomycetota bacterium]